MMNPEKKSQLAKYTTAVKHIIYDADRMRQLGDMMDTRDGAIKAVMTVLGVIEQKKQIPPEIKTLLAINTYVLMVDMLQEIHQQKPQKQAVVATIAAIIKAVMQGAQPQQQMPQPQPPAGLIGV